MISGLWIIILLFGSLILVNNTKIYEINNNIITLKRLSLLVSIGILYVVLYWWYQYSNNGGYELIESVNNLLVGIDSISIYFILLIGLILPLCILGNWNSIKINIGLYNIIILTLGILLLINFICIDILSFYILFESTLIPLFILIGVYGAENKEKAAYYVLLYTLVSSLFMLLSICVTTYILNTTSYLIYTQYVLSLDLQVLLWIGIMLAILVKSPLYPLHIWLPVVHSESPLGGSIILASIVLKLTIYLIIRWMLPFLAEASILYYPTVYIICLLTIIIVSLITVVQVDLKVIIAYSSISQIGSLIYYNLWYNKLMQHTICRKYIKYLYFKYLFLLNTNLLNYIFIWFNRVPYGSTLAKGEAIIKLIFKLVKILINYIYNPQIIKAHSMLVRISEAIRVLLIINYNHISRKIYSFFNYHHYNIRYYSLNNKQKELSDKKFNEWLAGLIDGNGYFQQRKINNLFSLSITMDLRDERCLYIIKQRLGGNVKLLKNKKAVRYHLHHKDGIINLAQRINGLIRTPTRINQFKILCDTYNIKYIKPRPLTFDNGWLSGFFDADGSISINITNYTLNISLVQKDKSVLEELSKVYPGNIYIHTKKTNKINESFRFVITREHDLYNMLNNYFKYNPSRTKKLNRIVKINDFFMYKSIKAYNNEPDTASNKAWIKFKNKWDNFE